MKLSLRSVISASLLREYVFTAIPGADSSYLYRNLRRLCPKRGRGKSPNKSDCSRMFTSGRMSLVFAGVLISLAFPPAALIAQKSVIDKSAAQSRPCFCADERDLINRINEANAAIDELETEQTKLYREKIVLQEAVKKAMGRVTDVRARGGHVEIPAFLGCKTVIKADTKCMKTVIEKHEDILKSSCMRETKGAEMTGMSLVGYIKADIAGYRAEIAEALNRLHGMQGLCRLPDWFGTITVREQRNFKGEIDIPPYEYSNGGKETTNNKFARWGTISYHGTGTPSSLWTIEVDDSYEKVTSGRVACSGGLKTVLPDRTVRNTHTIKHVGSGTKEEHDSLPFSVEGSKFTISVNIPNMTAFVKTTETSISSGGCKDENETTELSNDALFEGNSFLVEGNIPPKSNSISGSRTFDYGLPSVPGAQESGKVQVTWHLHKIPLVQKRP